MSSRVGNTESQRLYDNKTKKRNCTFTTRGFTETASPILKSVMPEAKYKHFDGVIVKGLGTGMVCDVELEEDEWTYSIALNNGEWGWFSESELVEYPHKKII